MSAMVQDVQKPKVTEIQVRMDCHGCVQKIKKALNGINGIYGLRINYPDQKITILGLADPEMIVKAIRKARKTATICAHFVPGAVATSSEEPAEHLPPEGESGQPARPTQPPKELPPDSPDNPEHVVTADEQQPLTQPDPEVFLSVPVMHHQAQPPNSYSSTYSHGPGCAPELKHFQPVQGYRTEPLHQPYIQETPNYISYRLSPQMYMNYQYPQVRATHNYNTKIPLQEAYTTQLPPAFQESHSYQLSGPLAHTNVMQPPQQVQEPQHYRNNLISSSPSPQIDPSQPPQTGQTINNHNTYIPSTYMTEYGYIQPPATHAHYNEMGRCSDDYSYPTSSGNISSMFSDENPNACSIM